MQEILGQLDVLRAELKKGFEECDKLLNREHPNKQSPEFYVARRKCSDLQCRIGKLLGLYIEKYEAQKKQNEIKEQINPNFKPLEKTNRYITSTTWERIDKRQSKEITERILQRSKF